MDAEPNDADRDQRRDDAIANAKLPAGLAVDGRDEKLESGDLVHPSGAGPHGHTTPPGTALPEEKDAGD